MGADDLLHAIGLVLKSRRSSRRLRLSKEVVYVPRRDVSCCRSHASVGGLQAFPRRHHRKIAGHHLGLFYRGFINSLMSAGSHSLTEIIHRDCGDCLPNARVGHGQIDI